MPFPSTKIIHPRWGAEHGEVSDGAMNTTVRVLHGTTTDWNPTDGPVVGANNVIYEGPARVSYDLDRPFTKDNADQITTTSAIVVALPRSVTVMPESGMTVLVLTVDDNGLARFVNTTLRVVKARHSGLSFGMVMDCQEMVGRTNG